MFVRPRDIEPMTEDLSKIMLFLMRLDAKVEAIAEFLHEQDDDGGEEEADA